jgi:hypothetical protein
MARNGRAEFTVYVAEEDVQRQGWRTLARMSWPDLTFPSAEWQRRMARDILGTLFKTRLGTAMILLFQSDYESPAEPLGGPGRHSSPQREA